MTHRRNLQQDVNLVSSIDVNVANAALTALTPCIDAENNRLAVSTTVTPSSASGTVWSDATVNNTDLSSTADMQYCPHVGVLVESSGPATFMLQVSDNNTDFYDGGEALDFVEAGTGSMKFTLPYRYARLMAVIDGSAVTVTAKFNGKQ